MRILIVNPGVQPELQKTVNGFIEEGVDVKYATASSLGYDYSGWFRRYDNSVLTSLRRLYVRRVLEFSDRYVVRFGFPIELFSYFLFRISGKHCRPIRNFYFYSRVFFFIERWNPNIIIFQDTIPSWYRQSVAVQRATRVLVLSTASPMYFHEIYKLEEALNPLWLRFFPSTGYSNQKQKKYLRDCNYATKIVVPSKFVFEDLIRFVAKEKISIVRLGYDLSSLGSIVQKTSKINVKGQEGLRVIFVGQLSQRKGISYLLEGFFSANISSKSILTLVGTSVLGSQSFIKDTYPNSQLRLLGHVSRGELGELLSTHDLFIMPSLIEGFCLSAVEALATGIPVAVTRVVLDNLIVNEENGFILDSHSSTSIRDLLQRIQEQRNILESIGKAGAKVAEDYTWTHYMRKFVTLTLNFE